MRFTPSGVRPRHSHGSSGGRASLVRTPPGPHVKLNFPQSRKRAARAPPALAAVLVLCAMTLEELQLHLDVEFAQVIERVKTLASDMDAVTLSGSIAGFLIKTGIALAVNGGAPRSAVSVAIDDALNELYGDR